MKHSLLSNRLFLLPIVLLLAFIGLAPLLSAIFNSFFHDIYEQRSWAGLDNYSLLLADEAFFFSLRITLVWATLATLFSLFLGYIFALKLVNLKWFSPVFYIILLIPWGIPAYIAVPLWRALLHGNGGYSLFTFFFNIRINLLTDQVASFIAALFVSVWMTVPLTAFVFVGMIKKIPRSMLDAARIDGADANDIGFNIYLPHISKAVLVMGILNFIKALKEFTVIFLMTAGGPPLKEGITSSRIIGATSTLEVVLYEIFSETRDFGIPATYSVIMIGLVIFFMVLWITIRRKNKSNLPIIIFTVASQVLFGGIWGLVLCLGYIISIKWKKSFFITFAVQFIINCIRVGLWGFLRAFDCGIIISLICLLVILRNTPRSRSPGIITLPRFFKYAFSIFSAIICIIVAVLTLLIVYLLVWMSISRVNACYMDTIIPSFTTFRNFINIFTQENVLLFFFNTLVISLGTAFLIPFICLPGASFLSQKKGGFPDFFFTLVKGIGIMTGIHSLIPLYTMFNGLNLINSYLPLVLVYLFHSIAFSVFTIKTYLDHLPAGLQETALLEGMRPATYLFKVVFPLSWPVIATSVMISFLNAWNGFLAPLLFLNDDTKYTISIKLYSFVGSIGSGEPQWNLFAATSVVNLCFIIILFLFLKNKLAYSPITEYED